MSILKKMSFWNKVRTFLGLAGPGTELFLIAKDVNESFQVVLCITGVIGYAIAVFMEDKNGNDIVDLLEENQQI
jgi:hypothetical protein